MQVQAELAVVVAGGFPCVVRLVGELDLASVSRVSERLADLHSDIEVDCSRLDFIDAAGLRALLAAQCACAARGSTLVVVEPSRPMRRLLDLTGLDTVLVRRCNGSTR